MRHGLRRRSLALAMALGLVVLAGCDWQQFGGDAGNTRSSNDPGITLATAPNVALQWRIDTHDPNASAVVAQGGVYVGGGGQVTAYTPPPSPSCTGNPVTCARSWYGVLDLNGSPVSPPAVDNGIVVAVSANGHVKAYAASTCGSIQAPCAPRWSAETSSSTSAPVIADGRVYIGTKTGVVAFDVAGVNGCSGTPTVCMPVWSAPTATRAQTPAVVGGRVFVTSDRLSVFDASGAEGCAGVPLSCTSLWSAAPVTGLKTPVVTDGIVVVASASAVTAYDAAGVTGCSGPPIVCSPRWTASGGPLGLSVTHGSVYAMGSTTVQVYDLAGQVGCSGSPTVCLPAWRTAGQPATGTAPAVVNGLLYVTSTDRAIRIYDATGQVGCSGTPTVCAPVRIVSTGGVVKGSPTIAQGVLYVPTSAGISAYRPVEPQRAGPCPANLHGGLSPCQLQDAYRLPSAAFGDGREIVIVDAFDDPNAEADLAVYRSEYGLPPCTTANGCFLKLDQNGRSTVTPAPDPGWSVEISLDLDMVSAICPRCRITLVEANDPSAGNLAIAEQTAISRAPVAVSNSFGGPEFAAETTFDASFRGGATAVVVASGDSGFGVNYPAASPSVVAVGGTELVADSSTARGWTETAWAGAGSGCSVYEHKPNWQTDTGCAGRTVADVAALAGSPGVAVYDSYGGAPGWIVVGGTSAAAPIVAGIYGLAPTMGGPSDFWDGRGLFDIMSGTNGTCASTYLCTASVGYDGPTGNGTPCGTDAFAAVILSAARCEDLPAGPTLAPQARQAPRTFPSTPACGDVPPGWMRCFARVLAP